MIQKKFGIIPRSVNAVFDRLDKLKADYTVRVSFLELYNEELQDLLVEQSNSKSSTTTNSSRSSGQQQPRLCDSAKGVQVLGLEEVVVVSKDDIQAVLERGIKQRQTAATLCNKNSSRSHSVFTLKIVIKETTVTGEDVVRNGQLHLVDLAGSECVGRSGAKNERAREAGNINQSLLTLGRVITALVEHHPHIPYRDSKLTRLLQESLGGRAKTCIIATVSPSALSLDETVSTLDYAFRAKNIENKPQVNARVTAKTCIKEYNMEIDQLKLQLQAAREKNGVYLPLEKFDQMTSNIDALNEQVKEAEQEIKACKSEVEEIKAENTNVTIRLENANLQLEEKENKIQSLTTEVSNLTKLKLKLESTVAANNILIKEQSHSIEQLQQNITLFEQNLQTASNDLDSLFNKIHNINALMLSKDNAVINHQKDVTKLTTYLKELVNEMRRTTTSMNENLVQKLEISIDELKKVASESFTRTSVEFESLLDEIVKLLRDISQNSEANIHEDVRQPIEQLKTNYNRYRDLLKSKQSDINLLSDNFDQKLVCKITSLKDSFTKTTDTLSVFLNDIQCKIELQKQRESSLSDMLETQNCRMKVLAETLSEKSKDYAAMQLQANRDLSKAVQKIFSARESKMEEEYLCQVAQLDEIQGSFSKNAKDTEECLKDGVNQREEFCKEFKSLTGVRIPEVTGQVNSDRDIVESLRKDWKEYLQQLSSLTTESKEGVEQLSNVVEDATSTIMSNCVDSLEKLEKDMKTKINKYNSSKVQMKQTIDEGIDKLFEVVNTTLTNDVKLSLHDYDKKASSFAENNITGVKNIDTEANSFADTNNRLVYHVTKSTPEKRTFHIPDRVPPNRLFDDILQEVNVCGKREKRSFGEMMEMDTSPVSSNLEKKESNQDDVDDGQRNTKLNMQQENTPAPIKSAHKKARQSGSVPNKKAILKESNMNESNVQQEGSASVDNVKLNLLEETNEKNISIPSSKTGGKRRRGKVNEVVDEENQEINNLQNKKADDKENIKSKETEEESTAKRSTRFKSKIPKAN